MILLLPLLMSCDTMILLLLLIDLSLAVVNWSLCSLLSIDLSVAIPAAAVVDVIDLVVVDVQSISYCCYCCRCYRSISLLCRMLRCRRCCRCDRSLAVADDDDTVDLVAVDRSIGLLLMLVLMGAVDRCCCRSVSLCCCWCRSISLLSIDLSAVDQSMLLLTIDLFAAAVDRSPCCQPTYLLL
jgi:hypothetical protein